jgi:hypothetical protein
MANEVAEHELDFTRSLIEDVKAARDRLVEVDTQTHRRELIRSVFAAIEGLLWKLRQDVYRHAKSHPGLLSIHEQAALREETYRVSDNGRVRITPQFLPLATSIRLVLLIVQRYRTDYKVDLNNKGWSDLKAAIEIRNRLVHPKDIAGLNVSPVEVDQAMFGLGWFLETEIKLLQEHMDQANEALAQLKAQLLSVSLSINSAMKAGRNHG